MDHQTLNFTQSVLWIMTPLPGMPRPPILLLLISLLVYYLNGMAGTGPQLMPDSATYLEWHNLSWQEILSNIRTPGYPWILSWSASLGGHWWIPAFQYALHVFSVLLFYSGLRAVLVLPWSAFWIALPLLFTPMLRLYGQTLLSDAPGLSLGLLSLSLMLWSLGSGRGWWLLAMALAATWLVRPMYLFLIPLLPLLAWLLEKMIILPHCVRANRGWMRVALVALLPFLLYGSLRWLTVDHFGVVSFGGINIAGIATPMISNALIPQLPEEVQPLARDILQQRQLLGLTYPLGRQGSIKYNPWYNDYNTSIHQVALPAAVAGHGGNTLLANKALSKLSLAILKHHPLAYAQWIMRSMVEAVLTLIRMDPLIQGLLLLMVLLWLKNLYLSQYGEEEGVITHRSILLQQDREYALVLVALMAVGWFMAGSLEVVLVEPPIERYVMGTGVLLPSLLMAGCLQLMGVAKK
ncbi:MAG: hypothetical protein G8345_19100 [Magnetococcales bacterium]|nr:hypothetical protein [Magnetococcales bacterium]NGZ28983.1 hypothetical protein [Magnetococcales bacterium]